MNIAEIVLKKIDDYKPSGHLEETARLFLRISSIKHNNVKGHSERVALMSEATAKILRMDAKAAFFAGLMHDFGKLVLPYSLFDDHDITLDEYAEIKSHALASYSMLKDRHLFTALCAGFHHSPNYGLTPEDFPKNWNGKLIEKVMTISTIISVCDFVDAFNHRHTKILGKVTGSKMSLGAMLQEKYPDKEEIIKTVLAVSLDPLFRPKSESSA